MIGDTVVKYYLYFVLSSEKFSKKALSRVKISILTLLTLHEKLKFSIKDFFSKSD